MLKLQNINWTLENGTQIIKDINLDIPDGIAPENYADDFWKYDNPNQITCLFL